MVFSTDYICFWFFIENNISFLSFKVVGSSNQSAAYSSLYHVSELLKLSSFCELAWTSEVQSISQVTACQQERSPLWETSLRKLERMCCLNTLWALKWEKLMQLDFKLPWNKVFILFDQQKYLDLFWTNLEATLNWDSSKFGFVQMFFLYKRFNEKWKISMCSAVVLALSLLIVLRYTFHHLTLVSFLPYREAVNM